MTVRFSWRAAVRSAWRSYIRGQVLAQAASIAATEDSDDQNIIVVTATKRAQSVQDVSISMNVLDGQALADQTITDFKDLATRIPGLSFQVSPTSPAVALRGFQHRSKQPWL